MLIEFEKPHVVSPQAKEAANAVTPAHPLTEACCCPYGNLFAIGRNKKVVPAETWNTTLHESNYHICTNTHAHIHAEKYIYTAHHIVLCYIIIFQIRKNKPMKWELRSQRFNSAFATDFLQSSGPVMSFSFIHFPCTKWEQTYLATNKCLWGSHAIDILRNICFLNFKKIKQIFRSKYCELFLQKTSGPLWTWRVVIEHIKIVCNVWHGPKLLFWNS